jgi:hypothetical protein
MVNTYVTHIETFRPNTRTDVQGGSASYGMNYARGFSTGRIRNEVRTEVTDIAHHIARRSSSRLARSAVEPTAVGVNEFWSGGRVSVKVV